MDAEFDPKKAIDDVREYRRTIGWVPYEKYQEKIYHYALGREHIELNMLTNFFDAQSDGDYRLREAAYLLAIKLRNTSDPGDTWTTDQQLELEEQLYNRFKHYVEEFEI
jgi:hypothetical protein